MSISETGCMTEPKVGKNHYSTPKHSTNVIIYGSLSEYRDQHMSERLDEIHPLESNFFFLAPFNS